MAIGKKKSDREIAQQITQWRDEGLTDAQIMAKHGNGDLSRGYKWLEANPAVAASGETTTQTARPARPAGAPYRAAPLPAS